MSDVLKISEAASLAMHAVTLMAQEPQKSLSTKEIASFLDVSENHLSKVLQRLAKDGLVKSFRGPKGGFVLGRSDDEITLLDVFEAIEGKLMPPKCLLGSQVCGGANCILSDLLEKVDLQVRDYLSGAKLSKLTNTYGRKNNG